MSYFTASRCKGRTRSIVPFAIFCIAGLGRLVASAGTCANRTTLNNQDIILSVGTVPILFLGLLSLEKKRMPVCEKIPFSYRAPSLVCPNFVFCGWILNLHVLYIGIFLKMFIFFEKFNFFLRNLCYNNAG